mmetsp:Transcript_15106/g.20248  ORF Transcript_15106/g.20248 Transcript_15106/m.20248 type:complete len:231 (-) Transcript_15106:1571-2263(-)
MELYATERSPESESGSSDTSSGKISATSWAMNPNVLFPFRWSSTSHDDAFPPSSSSLPSSGLLFRHRNETPSRSKSRPALSAKGVMSVFRVASDSSVSFLHIIVSAANRSFTTALFPTHKLFVMFTLSASSSDTESFRTYSVLSLAFMSPCLIFNPPLEIVTPPACTSNPPLLMFSPPTRCSPPVSIFVCGSPLMAKMVVGMPSKSYTASKRLNLGSSVRAAATTSADPW